jgi:hypothetical protein
VGARLGRCRISMANSRYYLYNSGSTLPPYRIGVCLHGHTLHSQESLSVVGRIVDGSPLLKGLIRRQRKLVGGPNLPINFETVWWTPPLSPLQALAVETAQIENRLGSPAMVSLTDHDNIDGPLQLRMVEESRQAPISVEWTAPFGLTYFHLGVHNLPAAVAAETMQAMASYRRTPGPTGLRELLCWITRSPETLVVLNHPLWDQAGIGAKHLRSLLEDFVSACRCYLHAVEINGLRSWAENCEAMRLADVCGLPLISGGDRHGFEPSAALNVTNATTFAEFAEEVRQGHSVVVVMPQYRRPLPARIIENMDHVLGDMPDHSLGWVRWSDRFFCTTRGETSPVGALWAGEPVILSVFRRAVRMLAGRRLCGAIEFALRNEEESFSVSAPALGFRSVGGETWRD